MTTTLARTAGGGRSNRRARDRQRMHTVCVYRVEVEMTKKKQRHALTRLLRATGAPMAVAAKAARTLGRLPHNFSLYGFGQALEARESVLATLGFGVEGKYAPCCSDESHGMNFEPQGVFYAPELATEEVATVEGRTLRTVYPVGTRVVPTYSGGHYR